MKRLVPFALASVLLVNTGCHIFSSKKNPAAPKESTTVATDVEKDFMHRWIEKRTGELVTQGIAPQVAHDRAVSEYRQAYSFTRTAQQAK
jgi:hypothetical protein